MNQTLVRISSNLLCHLGLVDAYGFFKRKHLGSQRIILTYHRVSVKKDDWAIKASDPEVFEGQIKYLCENFEVVPLEAFAAHVRDGRSLPTKAVAITFDDGYRDNYVHAYPILRKYGATATIFLVTGYVGTSKLFWWEKVRYVVDHSSVRDLHLAGCGSYVLDSVQDRHRAGRRIVEIMKTMPDRRKNALIEELISRNGWQIPDDAVKQRTLSWEEVEVMSRNGIDFGAHTVNHPILNNIPINEARLEILQSKKEIETKLGKPVKFFCYPNGDYDSQIVRIVEQSGFLGAVTVNHSWVTPGSNPFELGRVEVGTIDDFDVFKLFLCGLPEQLYALRRK